MLSKYSLVDLLLNLKEQISTGTGVTTYDTYPPTDAPSPFYFVEFLGSTEVKNKMLFVDEYRVRVHAIGSVNGTNAEIYEMLDAAREALTKELPLPTGYALLNQQSDGVTSIQKDETEELHAIMGYRYRIAYGLKVKI